MTLTMLRMSKSVAPAMKLFGLALASTFLLAGCGGGGGSSSGGPSTRIFVAGDSLFDMGTFGFKFTVQNTSQGLQNTLTATKIAIDHVAEAKGLDIPCSAYSNTLALVNTDCTSFAVGRGTISLTPTTAQNIVKQLVDMRAIHGPFDEADLILIDGGGNDFSALTEAFGTWATAAATYAAIQTPANLLSLQAATSAYATVLAPVTNAAEFSAAPAATVTAITTGILTAADAQTAALGLGVQYSVKLADLLVAAIDENLIQEGAKRILISNPPNIVSTPAFASAAALAPVVSGWVGYYNIQLESLAAARSEVEVYNFFAKFTELTTLATAASYGFTDVTSAACVAGLDTGVAAVQACSDVALTAQSIDWETYFFSDSFHGSPLANEIIANDMVEVLNAMGW